jgi:hypothetical protein
VWQQTRHGGVPILGASIHAIGTIVAGTMSWSSESGKRIGSSGRSNGDTNRTWRVLLFYMRLQILAFRRSSSSGRSNEDTNGTSSVSPSHMRLRILSFRRSSSSGRSNEDANGTPRVSPSHVRLQILSLRRSSRRRDSTLVTCPRGNILHDLDDGAGLNNRVWVGIPQW